MNESAFVMPESWWEHIHPRRGGWLRPEVSVDAEARSFLQAKLDEIGPRWASDSDATLVTELQAYLAGEASPLGAAAAAHLVLQRCTTTEHIVDGWVTEHGLTFAAETAVALGRVELDETDTLRFREPDTAFRGWTADSLIARARVLLAVASDADYDAAVEALEGHREEHFTRLLVSYLVPTREDWVDELCAAGVVRGGIKGDWRLLLYSLGTAEQLERVYQPKHLRDQLSHRSVLYTLADGVGPAIAPTIALLLDRYPKNKDLAAVLVQLPTDEAFDLLVALLGTKHGPRAVEEVSRRYPVRALRRLAAAGAATELLLRNHVHDNPELVAEVLPELPDDLRSVIEPLVIGYGELPEPPSNALPPVLLSPPWSVERPPARAVVVNGLEVPEHRAVKWLPGEREAWQTKVFGGVYPTFPAEDWAAAVEAYRADKLDWYEHVSLFTSGPENVVRPLLAGWRPSGQNAWDAQYWGKPLVVRYGVDALAPVLHLAKSKPATMAELLLPFVAPEVAILMADWLGRLKSTRPTAKTWLTRHAQWAARYLVPVAVGPLGKRRNDAEAALVLIPAQARSAARRYGAAAEREIEALLSVDPLENLPEAIPVPGAWADPAALPPIMLRDRESALPAVAAGHVITMLAMSRRNEVYPGVSIVWELCDPASLEEFSRALVDRWQNAGRPGKDRWVLLALDLFSSGWR